MIPLEELELTVVADLDQRVTLADGIARGGGPRRHRFVLRDPLAMGEGSVSDAKLLPAGRGESEAEQEAGRYGRQVIRSSGLAKASVPSASTFQKKEASASSFARSSPLTAARGPVTSRLTSGRPSTEKNETE